ncbi:MAG TPA: hypothetical protein VIK64_12265 [Anaerolineales bacterium]|jgi:hypothetical protein
MSKFTDPVHLRSEQFRTAANLNARIRLHQRFSTNPQNLYLWVLNHVQLKPGQQLLELGCGSGELWRENLDRLLSSFHSSNLPVKLGCGRFAPINTRKVFVRKKAKNSKVRYLWTTTFSSG